MVNGIYKSNTYNRIVLILYVYDKNFKTSFKSQTAF